MRFESQCVKIDFILLNLGWFGEDNRNWKFKFVIIGCDLLKLCLKLIEAKNRRSKLSAKILTKNSFGWRKIWQN